MPIARLSTCLILALVSVYLQAQPVEQNIILTGKLVRAMAIGGESTGWVLELEAATTIDGKQVNSIQVSYHKTGKLEKLENKRVKATGKLGHRHGVETGERPVLEVSSISLRKDAKATAKLAPVQPVSFSLSSSAWLLEDMSGSGVLDSVQATLTSPEAGHVAGNGSCNRFFGPAEIKGNAIKLGPLGSSRMACPEAVMNPETKYLQALQSAERFEWKDPYLLIYCKDFEKPLRFTRMMPQVVGTM